MIAAITAGGRADDPFARELGVSTKALASVSDITMLDRAIDAARATGARRIVIIGGAAVRAHCGSRVDDVIDESADGRENIRRAMAYGTNEPLLLSSSDMPFVARETAISPCPLQKPMRTNPPTRVRPHT